MYRITYELADILLRCAKDPQIPGILTDQVNPFEARNKHSIGYIDLVSAYGTDFDYIIEGDSLSDKTTYLDVDAFWLYKNTWLRKPQNPVELLELSDILKDVTDCCVVVPSTIEKLTCIRVFTLERLFELEPDLKNCVNTDILWKIYKN